MESHGQPMITEAIKATSSAVVAEGAASLEDRLLDRLLERLTTRLDADLKSPDRSAQVPLNTDPVKTTTIDPHQLQSRNSGSSEKTKEEYPAANDSDSDSDSDSKSDSDSSSVRCVWEEDEEGQKRFSAATKIIGVRMTNVEQFLNRFSEDEPIPTIDVLIAGEDLRFEKARENFARETYLGLGVQLSKNAEQFSTFHETWIRRIRIQSNALLSIFANITKYEWGEAPVTFAQPFSYFIKYYSEFKRELERLEATAGQYQTHSTIGREDVAGLSQEPRVDVDSPCLVDENDGQAAANTKTTSGPETAEAACKSTPNVLAELKCFVNLLETKVVPEHDRFQSSPEYVVRFDQLSSLFRIGELVYLKPMRPPRESTSWHPIGRVFYVEDPQNPLSIGSIHEETAAFIVQFYIVDFDGSCYVAAPREYKIYAFSSYAYIRDLDVYPLRLAPDAQQIIQDAQDVGRKFTQCMSSIHMTYSGLSLVTTPFGISMKNRDGRLLRARHVEGDVIVDFREAFTAEPSYCSLGSRDGQLLNAHYGAIRVGFGDRVKTEDIVITWSDAKRAKQLWARREVLALPKYVQREERDSFALNDRYLLGYRQSAHQPCDDDLVLLPGRVFGYSIRDLTFYALDVGKCCPVRPEPDAFRDLQLASSVRQAVLAAVEGHLWRRKVQSSIRKKGLESVRTQDLITGKGTGTTILLHGEPGVGKTATAEAIAHLTGRPLLPVNCGLLSPALLDTMLHLAQLWDCIVLFDEADVFLTARSASRPWADNSRVSDFLRKLEYHNGLLFLTTNRIGKIDPAISSRMTLILHYKRLQPEAIDQIFQANIKRLREAEKQQHEESGEPPIFVMERDVMRFAADHCRKHPKGKGAWNGREIRNAFVMAASLARHEAMSTKEPNFQPQLRYAHFQEVEKLTEEYNRFRVQLFGGDDSRKALLNEERDDEFENEDERKEAHRAAAINRLDLARLVYASSSHTARDTFQDLAAGVSPHAATGFPHVGFGQPVGPLPHWGGATDDSASAFGGQGPMKINASEQAREQAALGATGGRIGNYSN